MTVIAASVFPCDQQTLHRVCSEFVEMPGLQVTVKQARRLWGLDEHVCLQLLEYLVDIGFLSRRAAGMYSRLTEGRVSLPLRPVATPGCSDAMDID
jgi:hypothetical protein